MREIEQENWDDWEREDQYDAEPKCLFCAETFELPEDAFQHCQQVHGFDFLAVKRSLGKIFFHCPSSPISHMSGTNNQASIFTSVFA